MGSFGERMRRERDKRGITLDAISQATKIGNHILEAIEKDEFENLPSGIFRKAFVQSYARFLGMNEEQVFKEFIEVAGNPEQPLPDPPVPRVPEIPSPKKRHSRRGIAIVAVSAIVLLFVGFKAARLIRRAAGVTWSRVHRTSQPAMTWDESMAAFTGSSNASEVSTNQPENLATATLEPASQTTTTPAREMVVPPTQSEKFVILVKAHKPTWVSITADGNLILEGVLKRRKKIHAYSQVILKTNDAGAITMSRNGKPLPSLGDQDQQTTITVTPDGVTHQ